MSAIQHSLSKQSFEFLEYLSQNNPGLKSILFSCPQEEILEQLDGVVSDTQRNRITVEKMVEIQLIYLSMNVEGLAIKRPSRLPRQVPYGQR